MRYMPYEALEGRPNIVVDGPATDGTVLALSHWRGSGTPPELADDLSTQIVFHYLDEPRLEVDAEAVSNNHFDEDGLCGIYALLYPEDARARRDLLIDVASAGDFGTFRARDAARIAFALFAYADPDRSPLGLPRSYPDQCALLYETLLERLPAMLDDPASVRDLWAEEDATLERDLTRLAAGSITIEESPDIDLAIVTCDDGIPHESVVNNATERFRVLELAEGTCRLRYRYETWVQFVSRPVLPRIPLEDLAAELSARDSTGWAFDGVDRITPVLEPAGSSKLARGEIRDAVVDYLRAR